MSKSIVEQIAEAREKTEELERPPQPATVSEPYDPAEADTILSRVIELCGGESHWEVNFGAMKNGGKNAKGEPGVLGAVKTAKFSEYHPRALVLYNGNRGPNAVFAGFSAEEVSAALGTD